MVIKLRKKIEYYHGYEITKAVLKKVNLIGLKRYHEGRYSVLYEDTLSLEELCTLNDALPEEEYIILGEDWYIIYTKTKDYLEINEWVSVESVPNKLEQTMEMFNALKNILLSNEDKDIIATMKHNTSYKFYTSFIKRGYLEEEHDELSTDAEMPKDLETLVDMLDSGDNSLSQFLKDESRDRDLEGRLEDYIYHDVVFGITDKFKRRYRK